MSLRDQLLAALVAYGFPVLFGGIFLTEAGLPLPATYLLILAVSFAHLGEMNLGWVIGVALLAALLGDLAGYLIGLYGGRVLALRAARWLSAEKLFVKAEAYGMKWGGPGVFFTRFLLPALGPWINFASGIARYPYRRFLAWDLAGQVLWVAWCVILGEVFAFQIQILMDTMGNLAWVPVGLVPAGLIGWKLVQSFRKPRQDKPA